MPVASKAKPKKPKDKVLGTVTHYYDRLGVAVVKCKAKLAVGDIVRLKRGDAEFPQQISSLQAEHASVESAKKGEEIGMKVDVPVKQGTLVLAA